MKSYLKDGTAGVLILATVFLTMKWITLDLRVATLTASLLIGGYAFAATKKRRISASLILWSVVPLVVAFYLLIVRELPGMWLALLVFPIASISGGVIRQNKFAAIGFLLIAIFSFLLVPGIVEKNLSRYPDEKAPDVALSPLGGGEMMALEQLEGQVVVIDFFGTWCAPCIEEMKVLEAVKAQYKNDERVAFLLVCTQFGRDTPEKARKFIADRNLDFPAFFDPENRGHAAFGFTGVPALAIIDRGGTLRFKHEGYNASEDLETNLIRFINSLLKP